MAIVAVIAVAAAGGAYFLLDSDEWNHGYTKSIIDASGREVYYPDEVERVAALGPSALRLYCYAGNTDLIVGIEAQEKEWGEYYGRPYMQANPDFLDLETSIGLGGQGAEPDKEALMTANLDVLFITYPLNNKELDRLQNSIRTSIIKLDYGLNPPFDDAIYNSLEIVGEVVGTEDRANNSVQFIKDIEEDLYNRTKDLDGVTAYIGGLSRKGQQGMTSTTSYYSLFESLNIENVYKSDLTEIHSTSLEVIVGFDPQPMYIILDEGGIENIIEDYRRYENSTIGEDNPYKKMDAFNSEESRVFVIARSNWNANNIDVILANGYFIGKSLYPEAFQDIDFEEKFNEIMYTLLGAELYDDFIKGDHTGDDVRKCYVEWSDLNV